MTAIRVTIGRIMAQNHEFLPIVSKTKKKTGSMQNMESVLSLYKKK